MSVAADNPLSAATELMHQGRLPAAEAAVAELKSTLGSSAAVWALASEISLRQSKLARAWDEVNQAVELDVHNPRRHVQRARCAVLAGLIREAKMSVALAMKTGILEVDDQLMLASVLVRCDDHEGALACYKKAEAIAPDRNELQRGMASVYRFLGDVAQAEQACNKALQIDPHDYEMLNLRSSLRKQTEADNHVKELQARLERGVKNWRGAVQVAYALAKELEDLGKFDESFSYLEKGATLKRRNLKYDLKDDVRIFDAIINAFTREALSSTEGQGYRSSAPVFVLGLPRTGSTLVERIISSHSAMITAGEINHFAVELLKLVGAERRDIYRLDLPKASLTVDMNSLGKNYINAVRTQIKGASRFIDKLPLNSLYVGLIYLALPDAKVVYVSRHPVDSCFAMYKYLFKNAYPFSYDLDELAEYYIQHHRLMAHWREVLPVGWMHEVQYEDVVREQKKTTKDLLAYLGLEWEDACLEFYLNEQASMTGSASQVREPVYRSSIGKWRMFARHLQPLTDKLNDTGIYMPHPG